MAFMAKRLPAMTTDTARRSTWAAAAVATAACAVLTWAALGTPFFAQLFKLYVPRAFCMFEEPAVIHLHLVSDAVIALSYYSIPVALIYFVRRSRELTFSWIFVAFAIFILACGTTHVMGILALWFPFYRLDGLVKLFTALVSLGTAIILWPLIPRALAIPSPASLRRLNAELAQQVEVRRSAEESLRGMQGQLEARVQERTGELEVANAKLRTEVAARTAAEAEREELLIRERAARAEAEVASRAKDEFLAVLSHELRTPLNAITSWIHLLRESPGPDSPLAEGLEVIERNTLAQADLIEDLLDMSRIASGKIRMEAKPVRLGAIIDASVQGARAAAAAKGVALEWAAGPEPSPVSGDAGRLHQVVANLLSNAIKFTPAGGRVAVTLAQEGPAVVVTVKDTGAGIAPAFMPNVFDAFRQADSSTTRRHGGLGLGLAISRSLVELQGGTIRAESEGVGCGSTFTVRLPPAPEEAAAVPGPAGAGARSAPLPALDGLKILIVEDEADTREVLRRIFARAGAVVATAADAAAAWQQIRADPPALLVSDIGLPGEDGYSLIGRLRALPPAQGGTIPALALSAYARLEDGTRALAAGFQRHMAKPVDAPSLIDAVQALAAAGPIRP